MKVFISHTSKDRNVAERIGEDLLRYGVDVWLDKWDMFAGDSLYDRIEEGMRQVDAFVVLLSKASVISSWVRDELKIALTRRRLDPSFRIVPILLERVDLPVFLSDLIYIDWSDRDSAPFHALLRSLKKVNLKPAAVLEGGEPSIEFVEIAYQIRMIGIRGARAEFHESLKARALRDVYRVDRSIAFAGQLQHFVCEPFRIERLKINPHLESWAFLPMGPIPAGADFAYDVRYVIEGGFEEQKEIWYYTIEAPTDRLRVELDFRQTQGISVLEVFHKVGQTSHPEPVKPKMNDQCYTWERLFPAYKDTYEFRFSWK